MATSPVGYSGTPVPKKLGIKEGATVLLIDAPYDYEKWVRPLPAGVRLVSRANLQVDIVHLFVTQRLALQRHLQQLRKSLKSDIPIWVSWPKRTSKVATDITDNVIREVALPLGFVDIKVCAVSEIWSGLKIVVRRENR